MLKLYLHFSWFKKNVSLKRKSDVDRNSSKRIKSFPQIDGESINWKLLNLNIKLLLREILKLTFKLDIISEKWECVGPFFICSHFLQPDQNNVLLIFNL